MHRKEIYSLIKATTIILLGAITLFLIGSTETKAAPGPDALTLTVINVEDLGDTDPGDGDCESTDALGQCTLRAAIEEINAYQNNHPAGGPFVINLNIAGSPNTIYLNSPLPDISAPVTIDGTTDLGTSCPSGVNTPATLNIVLDGTYAGTETDGLKFVTGSNTSVVKGLVIQNFDGAGIEMESGVDNITIQCNHIGVNRVGDWYGTNFYGIHGSENEGLLIGGTSYADRNVISGNSVYGIFITNALSNNNTIKGNFVGTDATGTTDIPNGSHGIRMRGDNAQIGGSSAPERNVISGNDNNGITIGRMSDDWTVVNNYIGVDVFGTAPLGNSRHGISLSGGSITEPASSGHAIGMSGQGNVIAYNDNAGIFVTGDPSRVDLSSEGNTLRYNSVFENGGLGIDLSFGISGDGVTANDGLNDSDYGPNTLLNFPELSNAYTDGTDVTVTLDYTGGAGFYYADLYINDSCDPSGYGEGQTFTHTHSLFATGGAYNNTFSFPASGVAGKYLTSTATFDSTGNTSEFSNCIPIVDVNSFIINDDGDDGDFSTADGRCDTDNNAGNGDQCTLRAAIEQVNAFSGSVGPISTSFDIPGTGPHNIDLNSPLPTITHPILLDASTEDDAGCPAKEETPASIQVILGGGGQVSPAFTLGVGSDGSLIRGFTFSKFNGDAIQIDSDDNTVQCNHIGVDAAGTSGGNVAGNGVHISGDDNLIGGSYGTLRNVISANGGHGILLDASAERNDIYGNIIGLDATALTPLGNGNSGIYVDGGNRNNIGGSSADLGNIISANAGAGIFFDLDSDYNDVFNNKIGTDLEGNPDFGNAAQGIYGERSDYNNIGSSAAGGVGNLVADNGTYGIRFTNNSIGNWIRFNTVYENSNDAISIVNSDDQRITHNKVKDNSGDGIAIVDGGGNSIGNEISENSIYDNSGLGIDLDNDGAVEANDPLDADGGPNSRQNYPVLTLASGGTTIEGSLDSLSKTTFNIEFFSNATCDSSGHGEGKNFLGDKQVSTDESGHVEFSAEMVYAFSTGEFVTAVATDIISDNSSEFSACLEVICDASNPLAPTIAIISGDINLYWTDDPTADLYQVHRGVNTPYNLGGVYGTTTNLAWYDPDTNEVGDEAENHYYAVSIQRPCGDSVLSKTLGEFDFSLVPGS